MTLPILPKNPKVDDLVPVLTALVAAVGDLMSRLDSVEAVLADKEAEVARLKRGASKLEWQLGQLKRP